MEFEIRKVKKSDNLFLATMIREVFEEHNAPHEGTVFSDPTTDHLYELFRKENSVLWVAEKGNSILGCCGIYPLEGLNENYTELVKFYLPSSERGKGIGKALMQKSIESAKELGYKYLYLESLPHFAKAVNLYEKLGFNKLDQPLGNSGHATCNIWMSMEL